jgi:hypothetical protein
MKILIILILLTSCNEFNGAGASGDFKIEVEK